jgi:phosphoserine phosphatase RsbU/P
LDEYASLLMTSWPRISFVAGLTVVTVLGVIDVLAAISFVGALLVGVFLAALASSPRNVLIVGSYAVIWAAALGYDGAYWSTVHWVRLAVVVFGVAVAVAAAVIRERYVRALVRTANVAEVAQRALLRPLDERYDSVELAVRYMSASDGALIGGDVYDVELTPWGLRVLVADVCGHGLDAVDKASSLVFAFREAAFTSESLSQLARTIDESFKRHVGDLTDFASGIILQIEDDRVEIANCGHPDPLLIRDGKVSTVPPNERSRPFGLDAKPGATWLAMHAGDRLVVYTDGLTEARDEEGQFFDPAPISAEAFQSESLEAALDALLGELESHTRGNLQDDVVVLALKPA